MPIDDSLFLEESSLRHSDSAKWSRYATDVLPMWVADMDFSIAPSIRAALIERASQTVGYHSFDDPPLVQLLTDKLHATGFPTIPEHGLSFLSGVVQGLYAAVLALTAPGDDVLTVTPIYPPFLSAITHHGRNVRAVPLLSSEHRWTIDFTALEAAITPATRLFMLCHPHNPTGRVWNRSELTQIADFAHRHRLWVLTDELHADLSFEGPFIPFSAVAPPELQLRTLTLTGPCKTYNTAGLGIGAMIGHNPQLIARVKKAIAGVSGHPGAMSHAMWRAALNDDGQWLSSVKAILRENRQILTDFVRERLPMVRFIQPQATYLAWLDFRQHAQAGSIQTFLLEKAKVALNAGPDFGLGNEGFVRLNFATSPKILAEGLERIAGAIEVQ